MNNIRKLWQSLNSRERAVVTAGVLVSAIVILYVLVWEPWQKELKRLRDDIPDQRATLAWMQVQLAELGPLLKQDTANGAAQSAPLPTILENTARATGMRDQIRQMQPGENQEVRIWLQEVYFDNWLKWVEVLKRQRVAISAVTVNKSQEADKVNIRMSVVKES
jgi:general secretion pathway protein M